MILLALSGRSLKQEPGLTIKWPHTQKQDICAPSRDAEGFLLSQLPAHQGPKSSEDIRYCRTVSGTASKWWNNLKTQQPILWSDEYLPTGGMLIPSVLSQQAHMVPCCRRLQQERLFSRGCLQFIYTVLCTCCIAMLHQTKETSCQKRRDFFCLLWSGYVVLGYFLYVCSSHNNTNNTCHWRIAS